MNPLIKAVETAAYPVAFAFGITMLVVGPGRRTLPIALSLTVSIAYTVLLVLLLLSTVARIFRVGDITIRPGELPAPMATPARAYHSAIYKKIKSAEVKRRRNPLRSKNTFFKAAGRPQISSPTTRKQDERRPVRPSQRGCVLQTAGS